MRKDKMRQLSEHSLTDDANGKRHKHKHKCTDELCKHRKHKKRRKHKKHHHREVETSELILSTVEKMKNKSITDNNDELEAEEENAEMEFNNLNVEELRILPGESSKLIKAKNKTKKPVNIKLNKVKIEEKDEQFNENEENLIEDDAGSIMAEESSSSSFFVSSHHSLKVN